MRMSIPAYVSLGIATVFVIFSFALSRNTQFLLTALPMLLVLLAVPLVLNEMNKRHMDKVDFASYKYRKIKELASLRAGEPVRIRGTIEAMSMMAEPPQFPDQRRQRRNRRIHVLGAPRGYQTWRQGRSGRFPARRAHQEAEHLGDQDGEGKRRHQNQIEGRSKERGSSNWHPVHAANKLTKPRKLQCKSFLTSTAITKED